MDAPGYLLYLPPNALKARFIMIEETSKIMYDVDLVTPKLGNPAAWASEGITPSNTGRKLAIVIPVRLVAAYKQRIASEGGNPDFETGRLVSITSQEGDIVHGNIIGRVNVCPVDETVMSWDRLKEYKGNFIHDEMKNGLLAKVFGGKYPDRGFVHPEVLAQMPRKWHTDAEVLNDELDSIFASGQAVAEGKLRWMLSEDGEDSD